MAVIYGKYCIKIAPTNPALKGVFLPKITAFSKL
jgi:hypothetical protein